MHVARSLAFLVACAVLTAASASPARSKRQLADDDSLQPLEVTESEGEEQARGKRKLEGVTQAKFGVKNAILGFVFGAGTTSLRRTRSNTVKELTSSKEDTSSKEGTPSRRRHPAPITNTGTGGEGGSSIRLPRQTPTTADGIPIFDRNKVSLDFPGNLFGPSVSLLIRTTKIVGSVIQNSAVRYQTFLRLFSPLFRGQFAIKGLDPPTTTTTTAAPPPAPADNEVRR